MNSANRNIILDSIKVLAKEHKKIHVKDLIDKKRLSRFQISEDKLSLDYSKQIISNEGLQELLLIPNKINLLDSIQQLLNGKFLNNTEYKNVSHTLYRDKYNLNSSDSKEIILQQKKFNDFINSVNKKLSPCIDCVISISIGGSRLGPEFLSQLQDFKPHNLKVYYCSSYDLVELNKAILNSNPNKTLVVVSSKSFSTLEVLANANKAKQWLIDNEVDYKDKIIGISSNKKGMSDFGIKESNQFTILDSLGGRYSIWSSISLPAILGNGLEAFEEFKTGAYKADRHFKDSSWEENIPVIMALISCWNMNGLGIKNLGIFAYDYKARSLTKYLAQMGMESNGKSYNYENTESEFLTCPLFWGGYGPEAQHSTFQWLLQGKSSSACDFIAMRADSHEASDSYKMMLSQITALSLGKKNNIPKFKSVEGNTPISLLKLQDLSFESLGFLIACYEHKVFVESLIYGINPFDQWGVELGKEILSSSQDTSIKLFDEKFLP